MQNKNKMIHHCSCNKCICGEAEKLSVSCGCELEAKQYEYGLDKKMKHKDHKMNMDSSSTANQAKHDMSKMSHPSFASATEGRQDHEMAMTNPMMAKEMEADMKRRFFISLFLSIPILLYSPVAINFFKLNLPSLIPVNWLLFILTTPIVFWAGSIFIIGAYYSLKSRKLNMSVLIATGVLAAYLFSVFLTIINGGETFYEAAALLVTFVLFGHWMEMKSRRGTSDSLRALFDLVPPQAKILRNGKEITVQVSKVIKGDIVVIHPGDKIPVDGEIIEGETVIDESLVTGESIPVEKKVKDKVIGGSINQTGAIKFKAEKVGSETVLAQIIKLVETAQNSKAPGQRIADKAAGWLVILAVGSGLATFLGWYFVAQSSLFIALTFAVSTVVIACPDALGLATPTAVAVGTGIGAKHNILIKDATTLEQVSKIQAIVLDKTGTLTEGKPKMTDLRSFNGFTETDVLLYEASLESGSNHPVAKAIGDSAKEKKVLLMRLNKFESIAGFGLAGIVNGKNALAGKEQLLIDKKVDTSVGKLDRDKFFDQGKTLSFLAIDGKLAGIIAVADTIKPTAKQAIKNFKKMNIEVAMITGDHKKVAEAVGKELNIDRVFAGVEPSDKAKYVKKLQDENKFVAMVGDGINDAPALAQSDIGIAIGAGTEVAIETAKVVLMKSDPFDIIRAIILSKATVTKMKQNLFWAAIYNILAIPVAAGVFYNSFGISLRPEISALLMSASSIIVATNAVLLKRVESRLK